jgi:DNA-binding HxlR family transcriptional regulator
MMNGRRPIMALLDVLGQKWALRILWELQHGSLSSRALRSACGDISPTVLQSRVNELRRAGFIESNDGGYGLTPLGKELSESFLPLYRFANKWADSLSNNMV